MQMPEHLRVARIRNPKAEVSRLRASHRRSRLSSQRFDAKCGAHFERMRPSTAHGLGRRAQVARTSLDEPEQPTRTHRWPPLATAGHRCSEAFWLAITARPLSGPQLRSRRVFPAIQSTAGVIDTIRKTASQIRRNIHNRATADNIANGMGAAPSREASNSRAGHTTGFDPLARLLSRPRFPPRRQEPFVGALGAALTRYANEASSPRRAPSSDSVRQP
jgi:hypothetical protein